MDSLLAFGRVTHASLGMNPEAKAQISALMGRAYMNLHGSALTSADPAWSSSLVAAAMQICFDERASTLNSRALIQLFENVIIISEEHQREARRHAAMSNNAFYLKETALDALMSTPTSIFPAGTQIMGDDKSVTGRVETTKPSDLF